MPWFCESVVLARIDNELHRDLTLDQRLIELLRLGDRHARVHLPMHDHRRGLDVVDVLHRRTIPIKLHVLPRRLVGIKPIEITMNVCLRIHGIDVRQPRARRHRLEAIRLRQYPERHVSAIRPAECTQPVWIGDAGCDHRVDPGHAIFIVALAPGVLVRLLEPQPFACRAAKIRLQHREPIRRQHLNSRVEVID